MVLPEQGGDVVSTAQVARKVAAFVIRKAANGRAQLLVYVPDDPPTLSPRVPGGSVEEGESPEAAVVRELREETGMELPIVRRLGIQRYYKTYTQRFVERYDYLFRAPVDERDRWQHKVVGTGGDAGDTLSLSWLDHGSLQSIDEEHRAVLTPSYLPELFGTDEPR
jgi:8-oxo-dGTP pyrophosphatase MutT (NUDIX family)